MRYSRAEQIRRQFQRKILDGEFEPDVPMPPIKDLAVRFGVSIATMQNAFHLLQADGLVRSIRGKGSFPLVRRGRKKKRGKRIGLLLRQALDYLTMGPWPGHVIDALTAKLEKQGYKVKPISLSQHIGSMEVVEAIRGLDLSGIVLFEIQNDLWAGEVRDLQIPAVSLDYDFSHFGIPSVSFDNVLGVFDATRRLISLGHRNIVFIRSDSAFLTQSSRWRDLTVDQRYIGYRVAMHQAGLVPKLQIINFGLVERSEEIVRELMSGEDLPTAFVLPNQGNSTHLTRILSELGYSVPDNVSMIEFGGSSGRKRIKTTLIDVSYRAMGTEGARLLIDVMNGKINDSVILPATIKAGETVKAV